MILYLAMAKSNRLLTYSAALTVLKIVRHYITDSLSAKYPALFIDIVITFMPQ